MQAFRHELFILIHITLSLKSDVFERKQRFLHQKTLQIAQKYLHTIQKKMNEIGVEITLSIYDAYSFYVAVLGGADTGAGMALASEQRVAGGADQLVCTTRPGEGQLHLPALSAQNPHPYPCPSI